MARNNRGNNRPKRNFFTTSNKPVEAMTANEIDFAADRIFRDLARNNFDANTDGEKFKNPQLLASLINAAQIRFVEANLIAASMDFCFNDAATRGMTVDSNAAAIRNKWKNLAAGYNVIVAELSAIQMDGDTLTHLTRLMQQLWTTKQHFR